MFSCPHGHFCVTTGKRGSQATRTKLYFEISECKDHRAVPCTSLSPALLLILIEDLVNIYLVNMQNYRNQWYNLTCYLVHDYMYVAITCRGRIIKEQQDRSLALSNQVKILRNFNAQINAKNGWISQFLVWKCKCFDLVKTEWSISYNNYFFWFQIIPSRHTWRNPIPRNCSICQSSRKVISCLDPLR